MERFSLLLAFCAGNSPVNSLHKGQWRETFMFSLIYTWTNSWANNGDAGDLRRVAIIICRHCNDKVIALETYVRCMVAELYIYLLHVSPCRRKYFSDVTWGHGVSNHRFLGCLFNRLSKLAFLTGHSRGESTGDRFHVKTSSLFYHEIYAFTWHRP